LRHPITLKLTYLVRLSGKELTEREGRQSRDGWPKRDGRRAFSPGGFGLNCSLSVYTRLLPAIRKNLLGLFPVLLDTRRSTFSDLKTIVAGDVTLGDGAFIDLPIGDRTVLNDWRRFVFALELLHSRFGFGYSVGSDFEMSNFLSVAYNTIRIIAVRAEIGTFHRPFSLLLSSTICSGILCRSLVGRHGFARCLVILFTTFISQFDLQIFLTSHAPIGTTCFTDSR